ncbi:PREDICTED: E3 ubiquitin/ISG15 ligase TRIM25-like [Nanorana parkeri]|uniref:E3 ubiquitin/ISG15 ligase TRIM25-like n=1 Tax=Nanorana parkeri TaxID=125878 RepID=UPI000854D7AC|nr:PREDICTED: E3 ubiquitin/ISG15 ligase TRIM25-like [Nanorana parkeri]
MAQSLEEMIEELTCSICLSLFSTPVTIPCGHNFCSQCLELSWKESYTCPQCRFSFSTKPELRKNTLLSNLVSMAQAAQGDEVTGDQEQQEEKSNEEPEEEEEELVREQTVMCDSCRKNPASRTCLTCMASFCQDHLLPHLENPTFSDHQLSLPLGDLQQRKCMEHNKLMDHYCWDHGKCICCYCALNHKPCQTYTLEEGKKKKELLYINLLRSLDQKIERAGNTAEDVCYEQRKATESVKKKKELLEAEFEEIKSLIEEEQRNARSKIEEEEKKLSNKFNFTHNVLSKKKNEFESMRNKVQSLLQEQDDLQFLKRATKLKDATSKDPYKPKIDFDEKLLNSMYKNAASLRDMIKYKLTHGEETPEMKSKRTPEPEQDRTLAYIEWKLPFTKKTNEDGHEKPNKKNKQGGTPASDPHPPDAKPRRAPRSTSVAPPDSREQLLKYAERLAANFHTAHKKVFISERFTKMGVSETPQNYPDNPHRFVSCSQVLCHQAFRGGIHYWEVEKEGGNFSGFGVAYQSIARFGTESRLGRNKVSWCIEWCNGKLQAWHDDKQTDLTTPNASKYGVLLNCDDGYVAFFCVGKKCSQIYKFNARFTEPVYPAFWMFSSKTVLTLCQSYEP